MPAIRFLIADPSTAVQTFVSQLLESYGFESEGIKTCSTPQAGADIAVELKPDFLLTCWFGKESMSGIDLYRAVLATNPECRFAMLATNPSPEQEEQAKEAQAIFLLPKPFAADALRAKLGKALDQAAKTHTKMAQHVNAQAAVHSAAAMRPKLPSVPQLKPDDQVSYLGRTETVKYVILRRGELVVQLKGQAGLIEATKIQRLQ